MTSWRCSREQRELLYIMPLPSEHKRRRLILDPIRRPLVDAQGQMGSVSRPLALPVFALGLPSPRQSLGVVLQNTRESRLMLVPLMHLISAISVLLLLEEQSHSRPFRVALRCGSLPAVVTSPTPLKRSACLNGPPSAFEMILDGDIVSPPCHTY